MVGDYAKVVSLLACGGTLLAALISSDPKSGLGTSAIVFAIAMVAVLITLLLWVISRLANDVIQLRELLELINEVARRR